MFLIENSTAVSMIFASNNIFSFVVLGSVFLSQIIVLSLPKSMLNVSLVLMIEIVVLPTKEPSKNILASPGSKFKSSQFAIEAVRKASLSNFGMVTYLKSVFRLFFLRISRKKKLYK